MPIKLRFSVALPFFLALFGVSAVGSAGTMPPFGQALTYQGELAFDGVPVNGSCDFRFRVWTSLTGGTEIDDAVAFAIAVVDGRFTAGINCTDGDCFNGDPRWLEIEVRCPAGAGDFTLLGPRQELTPAPYAVMAAEVPPNSITSSEIADGTIQPGDVDGGLYSQKSQLYKRTETSSVTSVGPQTLEIACDDTNDMAIESGCWTSGPSRVQLAAQKTSNWESTSGAASIECTFQNTLNFESIIEAEILCLDVP